MDEKLSEQDHRSLLEEYKIVESKWRFFQGLRYGLTAFTATFQITLLGGFNYAWGNFIQHKSLPYLTAPALAFIPVLGLLSQTAAVALDLRLRQMYFLCSQRGAAIEGWLKLPEGAKSKSIFVELSWAHRKRSFLVTHTEGTYLMILTVYLIWLYLLVNIGLIESGNWNSMVAWFHHVLTNLKNWFRI